MKHVALKMGRLLLATVYVSSLELWKVGRRGVFCHLVAALLLTHQTNVPYDLLE